MITAIPGPYLNFDTILDSIMQLKIKLDNSLDTSEIKKKLFKNKETDMQLIFIKL